MSRDEVIAALRDLSKWRHWGVYWHTYPGVDGKEALHDLFCEFERLGVVTRKQFDCNHVGWTMDWAKVDEVLA